jgi:hypothetical protein
MSMSCSSQWHLGDLIYVDYAMIGAWIITGGTNKGVMALVGEAVSEYSTMARAENKKLVCIGIATWGAIKNNSCLESKVSCIGKIFITRRYAFYVFVNNMWNSLPENVVCARSLQCFKPKLHNVNVWQHGDN